MHNTSLQERKTPQTEQHTKPSTRAKTQQAAALLGTRDTPFVIGTAPDRAKAEVAGHAHTALAAEDRDLVLAALDTPAEPTAALRRAMALHDAVAVCDG